MAPIVMTGDYFKAEVKFKLTKDTDMDIEIIKYSFEHVKSK